MLTFGQWINNKETPSLDAATIDVENPTDNSIVGKVPAGCAADAEAALSSAKKAQVAWAKVPVGTRAKVLKGFAEVIRGCREELIETLIAEQSKVAGLATVEIGAFCYASLIIYLLFYELVFVHGSHFHMRFAQHNRQNAVSNLHLHVASLRWACQKRCSRMRPFLSNLILFCSLTQ